LNPEDWFFLGMDLIGGMLWVLGNGSTCEVLGVVVVVVVVVHVGLGLGDPVNIWTTCLKEELSAWTKVVGYGLVDSDLEMGLGDGSGGGWLILLLSATLFVVAVVELLLLLLLLLLL
jgi:hypothetical protein